MAEAQESHGVSIAALGVFDKLYPWSPPIKNTADRMCQIHQKLFWAIFMLGQIDLIQITEGEQKARKANFCFSVPFTYKVREHIHGAPG